MTWSIWWAALGSNILPALWEILVKNLIAQVKAADLYSDVSWDHFIEFVVAMRFAWLSEWLRKDDKEMIGLELDYMALLIQNRDVLAREWTVSLTCSARRYR